MSNKISEHNGINSESIKSYFPELTGMRAVAAYFVYLHHFNPLRSNIFGSFPRMFLDELHIGVSIFFVLSGFLIAYKYMDNFDYSKNGLFTYFKRRFARIYPMYFIMTVLTFLYFYHHTPSKYFSLEGITLLFANLTLLRGFFANMIYSLVGQGWSLTVEECFYLIAPILFLYRSKIRIIFYPIIILSIGCLLVLSGKFVTVQGFFESYQFMFFLTFFGRCTEFIIGMYLAIIMKKMLVKSNNNEFKQGFYFTLSGIIGIILCVSSYVYFKSHFNDYTVGVFKKVSADSGALYPAGIFINNMIQPVFIAMLFYGLITENTILKKILSSNIFILLGKASYVFYLIHAGIVRAFCELILRHIYPGNSTIYHVAQYVIMFIIINLISIFIYLHIEEKLHKYFNKFNLKTKVTIN